MAGVLGIVTAGRPGPGRLGAVAEVARYVCGQVELAELDASRARLDRAEVRALRARISPHFIYNALNTIASFVRTDPDRARELILEFADFTPPCHAAPAERPGFARDVGSRLLSSLVSVGRQGESEELEWCRNVVRAGLFA